MRLLTLSSLLNLKTVEAYFVITLSLEKLATADELPEERYLRYGQLVWMAVPIDEYPKRGKSIIKTRMKPIILTYLATEDIESFRNGFTSRQLRINRLVRWCHQAYDQGALLTQLDLAILLNVCDKVVCDYVNEWQRTTGEILPITRLSKRVISQYLDLIPQQQLQTIDANLANSRQSHRSDAL